MTDKAPAKRRRSSVPAKSGEAPAPAQHKPQRRRISPQIRAAIRDKVRKCITYDAAAKLHKIKPATLYAATRRENVQELEAQEEMAFLEEVTRLKAPLRVWAIQQARKLAAEAKSEAVRARMVEFLARMDEDKRPSINLTVENNLAFSGDYAYVRPGQQVVTIEADERSPATEADDLGEKAKQ
jgi:hypothetical protein